MSTAPTGDPPFLVPDSGGGMGLGMELREPPSDGVSSLRFLRHSDRLLVSSWDKTVRLYDAEANVPMGDFMHAAPVLDCCFRNDLLGFSAGGDNTVRRPGQVITGSWDRTIKCWDPRGVDRGYRTLVGTYNQPERVYSLSLLGCKLVVATAGRQVNVYDLRSMSNPEQQRVSPINHARCVECYPDGTGFALGSVEGRVAMEFYDQSESAPYRNHTFKCHRLPEDGRDIAYAVNAISFHPVYGTFATGGCDRFVCLWDGVNMRKKIQFPRYPSSIAALSFSRDGRLLAVASSYTFEEGDIPHPPDAIFIRDVNEVEVKPRPRISTARSAGSRSIPISLR